MPPVRPRPPLWLPAPSTSSVLLSDALPSSTTARSAPAAVSLWLSSRYDSKMRQGTRNSRCPTTRISQFSRRQKISSDIRKAPHHAWEILFDSKRRHGEWLDQRDYDDRTVNDPWVQNTNNFHRRLVSPSPLPPPSASPSTSVARTSPRSPWPSTSPASRPTRSA